MKKIIPVTDDLYGECFLCKNGVLHATPLLLILVLIESSDIIFAMGFNTCYFFYHYQSLYSL